MVSEILRVWLRIFFKYMWRLSPDCWNNGLPWWNWEVAVCPFPLGQGGCRHEDTKRPVTKSCPWARLCAMSQLENLQLLFFTHPGFYPVLMSTNCYWWTYSQDAELNSNLWIMLSMHVSSWYGNCVLEMVPIFLTVSNTEVVYASKVQMVAAFSFLRKQKCISNSAIKKRGISQPCCCNHF